MRERMIETIEFTPLFPIDAKFNTQEIKALTPGQISPETIVSVTEQQRMDLLVEATSHMFPNMDPAEARAKAENFLYKMGRIKRTTQVASVSTSK